MYSVSRIYEVQIIELKLLIYKYSTFALCYKLQLLLPQVYNDWLREGR